jgi:cyclopropane fatty-acyl-phospholipid synthase-like methyltransferase
MDNTRDVAHAVLTDDHTHTHMRRRLSWYADEEFWSELCDDIFDPGRWACAEAEASAVARLSGLAPGSAVLDLPCGPGRHVVPLAARGFRVTGVDLSEAYLRQARARLAARDLDAELVRADMRRFSGVARFDLALNLYTSFGYFGEASEDQLVLDGLQASLRPGGRLVLESLTRETVRSAPEGSSVRHDGDARVTHSWRLVSRGSAIERRFAVERSGERREFVARHRLYGLHELCRMLKRTGFRSIAAYGGFDGRPLTSHAHYAVLVATAHDRPAR